jgi:mRNA interferase RelE/StbE
LAWKVEFEAGALKDLKKLDRSVALRITSFLRNRVASLEDPRGIGAALQGSKLGELWRYRVGDYRIICEIRDRELVILAVSIGHRREIYR